MAKIDYPKGEKLARLLLDVLSSYPGYELCSDGLSYYHIKFDNQEYYIYFKCVTHEGNPYPLEHRRAQLPKREEFNKIKNNKVPFLFLGYDVENDVFVCWEPAKVKPRLNNKTYVSFYSRLSIQESVQEGKILDEYLTNGDKFVLFKRRDAISFFQMIDTHFEELRDKEDGFIADPTTSIPYNSNEHISKDVQGRLTNITDDVSLVLKIDSYPKSYSTLSIVADCMNEYSSYYPKMMFGDWARVIKKYLEQKQI